MVPLCVCVCACVCLSVRVCVCVCVCLWGGGTAMSLYSGEITHSTGRGLCNIIKPRSNHLKLNPCSNFLVLFANP